MTASSLALLREKDLLLLPNVDAEVATQLAAAKITTLDQITKTDKAKLMEVANLSEDAAEDLQEEAEHAKKESHEVIKLASVTKAVADALDKVGVKTISHLIEKGKEGVIEVFKAIHGDRAVHFVSALFDGIAGAGR
jgi:predicted RecB family nuclease